MTRFRGINAVEPRAIRTVFAGCWTFDRILATMPTVALARAIVAAQTETPPRSRDFRAAMNELIDMMT